MKKKIGIVLSSVPGKHPYLSSLMAAVDSHEQLSLVRALFASRTLTISPLQMCHPGQRLSLSDEYLHMSTLTVMENLLNSQHTK